MKRWVKVNNFSSGPYSVNKDIRFQTSMLRSDFCDHCVAYIVFKRTITVDGDDDDKKRN